MNLKPLLFALILTGAAAPGFAQDPTSADDARPNRERFCAENPATCQQVEERRKHCAEQPDACKKLREERDRRHEKMRAACQAHPEKCAERKRKMHEGRARCKADPASCNR